MARVVKAFLQIPAVMVGIALPLGFAGQIDAYLKYLDWFQIASLYAVAWLAFGIAGTVLAALMLAAGSIVARLARKSADLWTSRMTAWMCLFLVAVAFTSAVKMWLQSHDFDIAWLSKAKWGTALALGALSAVYAWRSSRVPPGLQSVATLGSILGGVTLLVAAASCVRPTGRAMEVPGAIPKGSNQTNIVLLTIDTLAADHMSVYGYFRQTTPRLGQLAAEANVFINFYANGNWTRPTVNSIFRGVRPWSHRANQSYAAVEPDKADFNLAALLKNAGYQTMAVATNEVAAPSAILVDRWFDKVSYRRVKQWLLLPESLPTPSYVLTTLQIGVFRHWSDAIDQVAFRAGAYGKNAHYDPELAFSVARDFLMSRDARPFFMWVHLLPPHTPYAAPAPFLGYFDDGPHARSYLDSSPRALFEARLDKNFPHQFVGRYDESILYVDYHVGKFIDWLKTEGLYEGTLLVITADHGENFSAGYGTHGGPLLTQGLIRIPLLVKLPDQKESKRLTVISEQIDIAPTILDAAGLAASWEVEGRSLMPAMRDEQMPESAAFAMNFEQTDRRGELNVGSVAMIYQGWKYVHYLGTPKYPLAPKLGDELYHLDVDPREITNALTLKPEIADKMLKKIKVELGRHAARTR